MPTESPLALQLQISLTNADAEEVDALTRQLCAELGDLDGISAALAGERPAPAGAKGAMGIDPNLLGLLAVSVGPVLLPKFLEFLHAWSMRREGQAVKVKLQTAEGAALEIEVPASMSPTQARQWVNEMSAALKDRAPRKSKK